MTETENVLTQNAAKYPQMRPQDAVKLLYQSEFCGGHIINDEKSCLDMLLSESAGVPHGNGVPLFEKIGNGVTRVNLAALDGEGAVRVLGKVFIKSAKEHIGSMSGFLGKLKVLRSLTESGKMPFDKENLEDFLEKYEKSGCPLVSHSDEYKRAYAPSYRVILEKYENEITEVLHEKMV